MTIEGNSERKQNLETPEARRKFLSDLFKRTGEGGRRRDVVMYHGTSVETLEYLIEHGALPGQAADTELHPKGSVFTVPDVRRIPYAKNPSKWLQLNIPPDEAMTLADAELYANLVAERHYVMRELGISMTVPDTEEALQHLLYGDEADPDIISDEPVRVRMEELLALPRIREVLAAAKGRKGVILGIKRSAIVDDPELEGFGLGDPGEGDVKLMTGTKGLKIEHLGEVRALGTDGTEFFERIRQMP
jgi:hypothetical protein